MPTPSSVFASDAVRLVWFGASAYHWYLYGFLPPAAIPVIVVLKPLSIATLSGDMSAAKTETVIGEELTYSGELAL